MMKQTTPQDPAEWSLLAERSHIYATNEREMAERELIEQLTPDQVKLFDEIRWTRHAADEIQRTVELEAVLAHLADPARVVRALFDDVVGSDGELPTCCAGLPPLPLQGLPEARPFL